MAANGAVLQSYTDKDTCLQKCKYEDGDCLAAQWRNASGSCFFVYDLNNFYGRFPSPGVDLYYLSTTCTTASE